MLVVRCLPRWRPHTWWRVCPVLAGRGQSKRTADPTSLSALSCSSLLVPGPAKYVKLHSGTLWLKWLKWLVWLWHIYDFICDIVTQWHSVSMTVLSLVNAVPWNVWPCYRWWTRICLLQGRSWDRDRRCWRCRLACSETAARPPGAGSEATLNTRLGWISR